MLSCLGPPRIRRLGIAERRLATESLDDVRENAHLKAELVGGASTQDLRDLRVEVCGRQRYLRFSFRRHERRRLKMRRLCVPISAALVLWTLSGAAAESSVSSDDQ